ncbi:dihydroneopterin aldolase [[Leptolyngbya] sp. PCC 7376]|uniref:dihydroneopterin aldolase n=1 Tax=[Leptolyngbya] sp. PCC 7376 TaxID=111781 RepID=UPI00029EE657|nr:dihydroneopterin aldolase [[Leptolyngbya] sp. PCC 7376]AFY38901.1 dihydroneopterin aldolase [[Leptolyngbya] sp. PCC 7376]
MDIISIRDIRGYGYTGFLEEEKVLGQWFEVDLELEVDLASVGVSDNLEDSVDYRQVIELTKATITNDRFDLVERLAAAIATKLLAIEKIQSVRVCLTKPHPPIPDFSGSVVIDITRKKG